MEVIKIQPVRNSDYKRVILKVSEEEEKELREHRNHIVPAKNFYWFITTKDFALNSTISLEEILNNSIDLSTHREDFKERVKDIRIKKQKAKEKGELRNLKSYSERGEKKDK